MEEGFLEGRRYSNLKIDGGRIEGLYFVVFEGTGGQTESLEEHFLFESYESRDWMADHLWRLPGHLLSTVAEVLVMGWTELESHYRRSKRINCILDLQILQTEYMFNPRQDIVEQVRPLRTMKELSNLLVRFHVLLPY